MIFKDRKFNIIVLDLITLYKFFKRINVIPNLKWVYSSPYRIMAFGFGTGLMLAPGTCGTLFAWLFWLLVPFQLVKKIHLIILILLFLCGCYICDIVGDELSDKDHQGIVLDEIISFWVVLFFIDKEYNIQLCAFLLFRLFDILKPFPIKLIDSKIKNGFGVMIDDQIAAIFTIFFINLFVHFKIF